MNTFTKHSKLIIIVGIFLIISCFTLGSYINAYNYGNQMDNQIKAQYQQSENVLAQYSQKIQELTQVPVMYKDDLKEVISATMQGRYGKDGSKAVFQWIKEHNLPFDASLYKSIMQNIEAGRADFAVENKKLIDIVAEYNTALGSFYTGFWIRLSNHPRIDLAQFKPITNDYASETFSKGKETGPIKLR